MSIGRLIKQLDTTTHFRCNLCGEIVECGHTAPDLRKTIGEHFSTIHDIKIVYINMMSGEIMPEEKEKAS